MNEKRVTATITSEKGFYIGDPCYVLSDDVYYRVWGDKYDFHDGTFEANGFTVAVAGTAYGDGYYLGSDGKRYPVDSGTIAVVPIELSTKDEEAINREHDGRYVEGKEAKFDADGGIFTIDIGDKLIVINTYGW